MVYVWLGLIVAFIAVEAATVNLVSIWFIGGSVAGLVCAILGAPTLLHLRMFILVSAPFAGAAAPAAQKVSARQALQNKRRPAARTGGAGHGGH